ncbi:MAG: sodium-dependent bicarbonate transport family permease [Candidatus Caenarcaniphilales bacterium]|nr:sodium-dependent bicarbonate transport family permease [Candidatus Caenarcaniphilales bacterium]
MPIDFLIENLSKTPAILFFILGFVASLLNSDLKIPPAFSKFLSIYLLLSIGFHGGVELSKNHFSFHILFTFLAAILLSVIITLYVFLIAKQKNKKEDAIAIAASYGSVSVVTFIATLSYLKSLGEDFHGYMIAVMAVIELPAILMGVLLARKINKDSKNQKNKMPWLEVFSNSSIILIIGSLLIGWITSSAGEEALKPFTQDIFKGMLCLFLLEMGILVAERLSALTKAGFSLYSLAFILPIINASIGIFLSKLLELNKGDALIFTVLAASASYVAVPAAMRIAVPRANIGLSVSLSLGITFPFNIIFGIPLYFYLINLFWK